MTSQNVPPSLPTGVNMEAEIVEFPDVNERFYTEERDEGFGG